MWFLIVLLILIVIIAAMSIKIVKQAEVYVIERLGKFSKVADAGLTIIIPFIDHVRSVVLNLQDRKSTRLNSSHPK